MAAMLSMIVCLIYYRICALGAITAPTPSRSETVHLGLAVSEMRDGIGLVQYHHVAIHIYFPISHPSIQL